ncbi:GIN domain-containing protein [Maribacter sp. 2-571]|uniref:GIN domain-containing protein n=1 Tax=Maribacter sp. 2-571 TaxID=3417569 RepID=UPI003D326981
MKLNRLAVIALTFLTFGIQAQQKETRTLEPFTNVVIKGRVALHLVKSDSNSMTISMKNRFDLKDFTTEVRGNTLTMTYTKKHRKQHDPKVTVYLDYDRLDRLEMNGMVSVTASETITATRLQIHGDGMVKGDLDLVVSELDVRLEGMCDMKLSGAAENARLDVDGMGKVNALGLKAHTFEQYSSGFAKIRMGSGTNDG